MKKKRKDINGWLIVDKPRDMGSTDVVSITRRLFNANKNGHAGTLDPFATGVLPIAFGEATKLLPFITDGEKEYEFVLQFGFESSTDDSEGDIVECDKVSVTKEDVLRVLPEFLGKIKQIPSKYSAIKIDGERAYDLARAGKVFEMPEREIEIYGLKLLEMFSDNRAKLWVRCSKGTYVRTLGKDVAIKLGTKGYLQELRRIKSGVFGLKDAFLLENLKNMEYEESSERVMLPMQACLRDIAVIAVSEADAAKLKLGQGISPKSYEEKSEIAVAVESDKLVAIVRIDERKISPVRVFNI